MPRGDVKLFQLSALLLVLELSCTLPEFVILSQELYCLFLLYLMASYKLVQLWLLWILWLGNYKEPCLGFIFEFALFCCVFPCLGLGIYCAAFVGYRILKYRLREKKFEYLGKVQEIMEQTGWQVSEPRVQPSTSKIWFWRKSYLPDIFNYLWKPHPVIVRLKNQKCSRSLICKYSSVNDFQRRNWFNIYMLELQNL
jgi:hypothetical protein